MTPSQEPRPRVVIADDHSSVLLAFARMLQLSCEVVASVSNGQQAVEVVSRVRPDVLIVDLMMPDLNGLEVCRQVKQVAPETAVIIVTAFDDAHLQTVALQEGAAAFLPKYSVAAKLEESILRVWAERQINQPRGD
jgi:DNA-binding NarL/FixJ family response regulator